MLSISGFSQESNKGTIVVRKNQDSIVDLEDYGLDIKEDIVICFTEVMPQFPRGQEELYKYLSKNISYPDSLKYKCIQGKVYVQFTVEKDGNITDVTVLRGLGKGFDEEAIRAIKNMPNWIPGEQRGEKVSVKYTLPIMFSLK